MRIVHYINQFFGGIGGEDKAGLPIEARAGAVGPGRVLEKVLGGDAKVVLTLICGDNFAAENLKKVSQRAIEEAKKAKADIFIAGPCFDAGRYGISAGGIAAAVQAELGIPAVAAMSPENPGVDLYKSEIYIVDSGSNVGQMEAVLTKASGVITKLVKKEKLGRPSEEGYIARGFLHSEFVGKTAGERLVNMLLNKTTGQPFESELPVKPFDPIPLPPAIKDMKKAKIAIVTDGSLVPIGNPDKFPTVFAKIWKAYDIKGKDDLKQGEYDIAHSGYDNRPVLQDPDRLVPVDVLREFEKQGIIGKLHDQYFTTTGNVNPVDNSRRLGREMAQKLKEDGVDAVILTST